MQVAAFTGLRSGELDALRWERIDFDRDRIVVAEQFNAATRRFDTPKNHLRREAPLTAHARSALLGPPREGDFSPRTVPNAVDHQRKHQHRRACSEPREAVGRPEPDLYYV